MSGRSAYLSPSSISRRTVDATRLWILSVYQTILDSTPHEYLQSCDNELELQNALKRVSEQRRSNLSLLTGFLAIQLSARDPLVLTLNISAIIFALALHYYWVGVPLPVMKQRMLRLTIEKFCIINALCNFSVMVLVLIQTFRLLPPPSFGFIAFSAVFIPLVGSGYAVTFFTGIWRIFINPRGSTVMEQEAVA
ncbi:hypothetical protein JAAARDRAFT_40089 [Jaapia argillacea MUCL 33604]|uniref:Uncharacterized protein n=1 Tax=Jaapia argillacea MUCL 33604 TaxID=933084 RepID=A0A067PC71_9AGAM|nr:hypothetical protein JAAARDRAFT_40089 [Jaapia argillacea MUCL 33604]